MALQQTLTLDNGIELTNAYIKIASVTLMNAVGEINKLEIKLNIYKDQNARVNGKPEVLSLTHICTGSEYNTYFGIDVLNALDNNIISQSYSWLKTLASYSAAIDVEDTKEV